MTEKKHHKPRRTAEIIDLTAEGKFLDESDIDFDELRARAVAALYSSVFDSEEEAEEEAANMSNEELLDQFGDNLPPTRREYDEENEGLLRRQRQFRQAADYVTQALMAIPAVRKVVLFGSVAVPLKKEVPRFRKFRRAGVALWHECSDLDLAVWLDDSAGLKALQKARAQALKNLLQDHNVGVATHQVEIFILEPGTDRYLGRLCNFATCPKERKWECLVPGCGAIKFLQLHKDFTFHSDALAPDKTILLFDRQG